MLHGLLKKVTQRNHITCTPGSRGYQHRATSTQGHQVWPVTVRPGTLSVCPLSPPRSSTALESAALGSAGLDSAGLEAVTNGTAVEWRKLTKLPRNERALASHVTVSAY